MSGEFDERREMRAANWTSTITTSRAGSSRAHSVAASSSSRVSSVLIPESVRASAAPKDALLARSFAAAWLPRRAQGDAVSVQRSIPGSVESWVSADARAAERRRLHACGVPAEWRMLDFAHHLLFPDWHAQNGERAAALLDASAPVLATPMEVRQADRRDAHESRQLIFAPSEGVRCAWLVLPWVLAVGGLVVAQIFSLAILETHLEPTGLTDSWLQTSALSFAQGWLAEPLTIISGMLVSTHAERLIERAGCFPLLSAFRAYAATV
ncbi:hypothetical protein T492DRAFT_1021801 [Pavlovales sp. CCMP2436]|nr:hypothetical protein T492DRAFT_1021801 [Pavlovales sp. CCMP2436]|mmetsp:Transcript_5584/g.14584  ORF Transcript_5584/g.14584 Transcript_5584/m.14584 type:complete len:268 (+) Transcript_5584:246-1049(+)